MPNHDESKPPGERGAVPPPQDYPAERARQGMIVLRTPQRRLVFFGALALAFLIALVLVLAFYPSG